MWEQIIKALKDFISNSSEKPSDNPRYTKDQIEENFISFNEEKKTVDILLYGDIGWELDGNIIAEIIQYIDQQSGIKEIHERINSRGGGIVNGLSVVAANFNSNKKIITHNDGAALSMGGVILMSGDQVEMADFATLMIHEPRLNGQIADEFEDEKMKNLLNSMKGSLVKIIQGRCNKTKAQIEKIMKAETWYNAKEAKAEGFIDKIVNLKKDKAKRMEKMTASVLNSKPDGSEWDIVIVNSGHAETSTGKRYLAPETLRNQFKTFNNIDVYMHSFGTLPDGRLDIVHNPIDMDKKKVFGNKVGVVRDVIVEDRSGTVAVVGKLHIFNPVVRETLMNIWHDDRDKMPEFSINADHLSTKIGDVSHIVEFIGEPVLDMVTEGAFPLAKFERLAASKHFKEDTKVIKEIIGKILAMVKEGKMKLENSIEGKTDDEITNVISEALGLKSDDQKAIDDAIKNALSPEKLKEVLDLGDFDEIKNTVNEIKAKMDKPADPPAPAVVPEMNAEIKKMMDDIIVQNSQNLIEAILNGDSALSVATKDEIKKSFDGKVATKEQVQASVKEHKEYLDKILASSKINGRPFVEVGNNNNEDKLRKLLEVFVSPELNDDHTDASGKVVEGYKFPDGELFKNFVDVIRGFAGHMNFEGQKTMAAAATSNFTTVFQDVMNKQIRTQYSFRMVRSHIPKLAQEVSIDTLDEQHIYDIGSFGLISDVSEAAAYQQLGNPDDMEATYTPKKIGNIFRISEEMFFTSGQKVNQLVRQFPKKMADAALATFSKYVYDMITGCNDSDGVNAATIYDAKQLYHADHGGNITDDALSFSTYSTAYTAMVNQTVLSSVFPAEVNPRYLIVPTELRETAHIILKNATYAKADDAGTGAAAIGNPYNFDNVEPIVLPKYYLCNDPNNWYMIANKNDSPTLQIGYFQNQRAPQIFLQNDPTVANVFTNDQWTWKAKWRFGGAITDYRGFYGGFPVNP